MDSIQQLVQLGLSEKQARTYLALLELTPATAMEVAKKSGLKRPTTYVILDELVKGGLARSLTHANTTVYEAEPPEALQQQLERKVDAFSTIKPLLDNLYIKDDQKPKVRMYSGVTELRKLYESIFAENERIDFFGVNFKVLHSTLPNDFADFLEREAASGKCIVRNLLTMSEFNSAWARRNISHYHRIRLSDPAFQFAGDNAVFGNTLMITSFEDPFAVTIDSADVAKTYRSLFEIAWAQARHPRDLPQKNVPRGTNKGAGDRGLY